MFFILLIQTFGVHFVFMLLWDLCILSMITPQSLGYIIEGQIISCFYIAHLFHEIKTQFGVTSKTFGSNNVWNSYILVSLILVRIMIFLNHPTLALHNQIES